MIGKTFDNMAIEEIYAICKADETQKLEEPCRPIQEPCFPLDEPCVSIEEPCAPLLEPCAAIGEPCLQVTEICPYMRESVKKHVLDTGNLLDFQQSGPTEAYAEKPKAVFTITITRNNDGIHSTTGSFTATASSKQKTANDNILNKIVKGFTMEPKSGRYDLGYGEKTYPIPTGTYKGVERGEYAGAFAFRILMPSDVNFSGILIHTGEWPWDTDGCILVGDTLTVNLIISVKNFSDEDIQKYIKQGRITRKVKNKHYIYLTDRITGKYTVLNELKNFYNEVKSQYDTSIEVIIQ